MMKLGALLGGGNKLFNAVAGSVASGLFNQRSANKSMQFSSAQAARQMQFQDEQSRTQYQRAVADMKKAGINPMLAAKLGGNAAMSGAMASGAQATMPDIGSTINSAENLRQMEPIRKAEAELKGIEVNVKKLKDLPAATVKGFKDRIVSQAVKVIDDYVKLTGSHGFDNNQLEAVESVLNSLRRSALDVFIQTLQGVDKGTLKILEGLDWFKSMMKDL
ncbi:DNA pilot protein [Microviridae sp.]|nr:DNA pilot protein [Microviridae sp.]